MAESWNSDQLIMSEEHVVLVTMPTLYAHKKRKCHSYSQTCGTLMHWLKRATPWAYTPIATVIGNCTKSIMGFSGIMSSHFKIFLDLM